MSSVAIENLDIRYGNVHVVKSLDLQIKDGEFLVLLGPSGCGKSTLLNAIGGLTDVSGGTLHFNDRDVTWTDPKDRGIGMVFQSYALYPTMTVERNMSFGLRIAGVPRPEIEKKVKWASELLQITQLLDRKPSALSGGQRQRVAIGRALVRDADIFLFDEPLSNLDAKLRAELRLEIKKLHKALGSTMIYVTHDQIEALTLADRIAVMKDGIIQQLDTPLNVYNKPANEFVGTFLGSPAMNKIAGAFLPKMTALSSGPVRSALMSTGIRSPERSKTARRQRLVCVRSICTLPTPEMPHGRGRSLSSSRWEAIFWPGRISRALPSRTG
nr:ABC transporter ATP-binding protein [Marinicella sp. W31]MDC2880223.1 ABC transporter ATP-binding protein [Marinicella sp. W31]